MRHFFSLRYLPLVFVLLCTACGTALPTVKPYKLDVQQGNVVTSKMLLQLRPGMTKSQVRFIMGTPLIQDSFHGNRWDYVYQLREKGKIVEQRRVILDFENELLKTVRGDVIPAGSGPKENETGNTGTRTVQPVDKAKEKGLMDKLKFWKKDEVPPAVVPPEGNKPVPASPQSEVKSAPEDEHAAPVIPADQTTPNNNQPDIPSEPAQAPATEESKSILSVPMEVPAPAAAPEPASEPSPATVPPESVPANVESAPNVNPTQSSPPANSEADKSTVSEPTPEQPVPYEPSTGLQFDRDLKQENSAQPAEAIPSETKPVKPAPRVGNTTAPTPKDLPAEGEPDFFEKMLEKIGF